MQAIIMKSFVLLLHEKTRRPLWEKSGQQAKTGYYLVGAIDQSPPGPTTWPS
jgi:hypothetical protein